MPPAISPKSVRDVEINGHKFQVRGLSKREAIEIDLRLGRAFLPDDEPEPAITSRIVCDVVGWVLVGWDRPEPFPGGVDAIEEIPTIDLLLLYQDAMRASRLDEADRKN